MCKTQITMQKFLKLILEVEFYKFVIYFLFVVSGYEAVSILGIIKVLLPITSIETNFTGCFLMFYLCIPFLNILVKNMDETQRLKLLSLVFAIYIFMGTMPKFSVSMNYVSWFCCLYFIAAYIRLYPKKVFHQTKIWGISTAVVAVLCIASVLCCVLIGIKLNRQMAYFFVSDSNTLLAVCMGVCSFLFFKNLNIPQSRLVNMIASSTFGVLLIHANSDTMRKWLWNTTLGVEAMFYESTSTLILHAVVSVFLIFIICIMIDQIRIQLFEKFLLDKITSLVNKFAK